MTDELEYGKGLWRGIQGYEYSENLLTLQAQDFIDGYFAGLKIRNARAAKAPQAVPGWEASGWADNELYDAAAV